MSARRSVDIREGYCEYVNPFLGALLKKVRLDKVFITGNGAYLFDDEGNTYLDFLSNYGATLFGHNYPPLKAALEEYLAANKPTFVQPSMGSEATKLAKKLVELSPNSVKKVVFTNSGAESVELCIKVARAATGRRQVLTAANSFHGKTIGALSATGQAHYQKPYHLPLSGFHYVPFGDIAALKSAMEAYGETLSAFVIELIQGEGGVVQADAEYFSAAQDLCRRYGVMFVVDEVQTGLGRAGHIFYSSYLGLEPDAIALAKGLGGGLLPIGAVLLSDGMYTEEVALTHSSTFAGNGMACRVGNAVIDELCSNGQAALKRARETGVYLKEQLLCVQHRHPGAIKAINGDGLMLGVEFVAHAEMYKSDRGSMLALAAHSGMLLPLISGYLANVHRIRVAPTLNNKGTLRIQPPLNITREQCDTLCEALNETARHLASGDTFALTKYLLKSGRLLQADKGDDVSYRFNTRPTEDDKRFGFIIHPVTLELFQHFDTALSGIEPADMRALADMFEGELDPVICGTTRITAKDGSSIYGEFAALTYLPDQLLSMPPERVMDTVGQAVLLLKERGAKIVGLGGYTSIASKAGTLVSKLGVAVTTGNSYTVLSAIQAVKVAIADFAPGPKESLHVAVVGAGGSIGSSITREMALSAKRITVIGNGKHIDKTRRRIGAALADLCQLLCDDASFCAKIQPYSVAGRLKAALAESENRSSLGINYIVEEILAGRRNDVGISWGTDTEALLPQADVTFVATSSTDILVHPQYLKKNAIVCDLSRPSNVNHSISRSRPDVLMIDGGVIRTPCLDDLGVNFGFPKGLCYACMAETMMLAFDRRYENTSLGGRLKYEDQAYFGRKAAQYGFSIEGFRSFDLPITEAALERLYRARRQEPVVAPLP